VPIHKGFTVVRVSQLYWRKGPLGIDICMYVFPSEHNPPHFHVYCGEDEASISIHNAAILVGELDATTYKEVYRWWERHQKELLENWRLVSAKQRPKDIDGEVD
jgi:hypothetical protein